MHDSLPILLKVEGLYQRDSQPADTLRGEAELKGTGGYLEIRFPGGETWQAERRSVGLLGGGGTALDVSARGCTIRLFRQ